MSNSIIRLSTADSVGTGDFFAISSTANGDDRKVSGTNVISMIEDNITLGKQEYTTQYSAPSATGFSVQVTDGNANIWLVLTPAAGYATGTIVLPTSTNLTDKQEILVNCTQDVTTLTIDKNGATALTGAPTSITANDFFKLKYDLATSTWYRIG